ncbi:putative jacalin-like lectin domain-containing protein [Helianthus debilis subsp. tardiflorus]
MSWWFQTVTLLRLLFQTAIFYNIVGSSGDYEGCITRGPWGGTEGHKWVYMPQPFTNKIKIRVRHGSAINSIELQSYCTEGEGQISIFGGQDGTLTDTIYIDGTNEYLMSISGTSNCLFGTKTQVMSYICFMTNLNLYGPYGNCFGATFSHDVKDGVVVGFHGRASKYLNAIGIYVLPKSLELDSNSKSKGKIMSEVLSLKYSRMVMPRGVGPWGAGGGQSWDDGVFSTIKQVRVHVGELNVIYALQFEYQKRDGTSVLSQIHGGTNGLEIKMVNMDDKDEFIIGVSAFYGLVEGYKGLEAIVSISFHTNKRIHGPYGEELGASWRRP